MRHQQEAEKEEKKRLKNLVLNLDLRDDTDADGTDPLSYLLQPNPNVKPSRRHTYRRLVSRRDSHKDVTLLPSSKMSTQSFVTNDSNVSNSISYNDENENTHSHVQGGSADRNLPNPYLQPRVDRAGKGRASQRGRQLQVSDLDWYCPHTKHDAAIPQTYLLTIIAIEIGLDRYYLEDIRSIFNPNMAFKASTCTSVHVNRKRFDGIRAPIPVVERENLAPFLLVK
jgi:hypothetical protein